ncbi:DNA polymerase III subunit gamma/tau [Prosthecobacter sp. SYSU 5D2]|uniref:DNA polymerase III subunit gamma/tau n=1 Tax=Prosthecobacter sp. SYSU 5D2 TaxID=3134134 RepID=UPI0031FEDFD9
MSYQVFARKYRPKTFADVLGQEHVVRTLRNAIAQNRLAHAYLFVGPRGTGKTSTARIFAKALNCPNGPSVDFDPEDELCREIAEGRSLDVLEIDGASNNGVDQVRDLRESVKYAPSRCRYKIYYIDEVHMLSTAAFNALLKTLEEPPDHVKFIFATTEANKILPTIISRCQRFDLRRIPNTIIAKHLLHIAMLEKVDLDEKAAFAIAKGADGGMRDAQSMLDQLVAFCGDKIRENDVLEIFGFTAVQSVSQMVQHILESDTVNALRLVHDTSEAGKDLGRMLGDLIQHFRTLLVSQADPDAAAEDLEPEIADQVSIQSQMASTEQLLRIVDGLAEVDARMRWATNKRLHFELGVIQAVQHYNEISISDVIEALDGGGAASLPRPAPRPQPTPVARRAAPVTLAAPEPIQAPVAKPQPAPAPAPEPEPTLKVAVAEASPEPSLLMEELEPEPASPPPAPDPDPEPEPPPAPAPEPPPEPEPAPQAAPVVRPQPLPEPAPPTAPSLTNEEFRLELVNLVKQKRPLAVSWLEPTTVLSMARGIIKLGFPTSESHAKESLDRDNQRTFLEGLANEILGTPMRFEMVVDPSLKPPPAAELFAGFDLPVSAPPTAPKPATAPVPVSERAAISSTVKAAPENEAPPAPTPDSITEDFQNDPLIKSAIEKFKLKLAASGAPQA